MDEYTPERQGTGRRMDDNHCTTHEKNTTDIAGMKSSMGTMKWIIGILVPVSLVVTGWFQVDNRNELKEINGTMKGMQASMQISITSDAVRRLEIEQIKRDVEDLRSRDRR